MRPPSVVVRDLLPEEGNQLKRLSRKASSELKRERALICWASATRMSPQQIAALVAGYPRQLRGNVAAPAGRTVTYMPRLRGAKWECGPRVDHTVPA